MTANFGDSPAQARSPASTNLQRRRNLPSATSCVQSTTRPQDKDIPSSKGSLFQNLHFKSATELAPPLPLRLGSSFLGGSGPSALPPRRPVPAFRFPGPAHPRWSAGVGSCFPSRGSRLARPVARRCLGAVSRCSAPPRLERCCRCSAGWGTCGVGCSPGGGAGSRRR